MTLARQLQAGRPLPTGPGNRSSHAPPADKDVRLVKFSGVMRTGQDSSSDSEKQTPRTRRSRQVLKNGKPVLLSTLLHGEPRLQLEQKTDDAPPQAPQMPVSISTLQSVETRPNFERDANQLLLEVPPVASPKSPIRVNSSVCVEKPSAAPQVSAQFTTQSSVATPGGGPVTVHNVDSDSDDDEQLALVPLQPTTAIVNNNGAVTAFVQVALSEVDEARVMDAERLPTSACISDSLDEIEVTFVLDSTVLTPILLPRGANWLSVVQASIKQVSIAQDTDCKRVTRFLSQKSILPSMTAGTTGLSYRDEKVFAESDLLSSVAPIGKTIFIHLQFRPDVCIKLQASRKSYDLDVYSTDLIADLSMLYDYCALPFYEESESHAVGLSSPIYLNNILADPQASLNSLGFKSGDRWSTYQTTARKPAKAHQKPGVRSAPQLISMPLHSLPPMLIEQAMLVRETTDPHLSKPGDYVLFVHSEKAQVGTLVACAVESGECEIHVANPAAPGKHGAKTVKRRLLFSPVPETWRDLNGAIWLGDGAIEGLATRRSGQTCDIECMEEKLEHLGMQASTKQVNRWKRQRHPNGSASSNSDMSDSSRLVTRQDFLKQRLPSGKSTPKSRRR